VSARDMHPGAAVVAALAAILVAMVLNLPLLWIRALVLLAYVEWFVRPVFPSFPAIPAAVAMGLVLLPQVLRHHKGESKKDDEDGPWMSLAKVAGVSLITSGMLWVSGWLVSLVGGM
jgi:hypothetical protein